MKDKVIRILGPFFGLTLWVLHHELSAYHYDGIVGRLREIPNGRLSLSSD